MRRLTGGIACIALALLTGCSTTRLSSEQLAKVAKDWSLSIRASQVIPVYPLTEDLVPGDVFLVQTPVEDQVKVYAEKGFLPLENLIARLDVAGYQRFYRGWPGVEDGTDAPPRGWQFPDRQTGQSNFDAAPLAKFPTYSFSVSRSGGLNVAIPVQGVPLGLNLLDSGSATGMVTMKDSYTYGLPATILFDSLTAWAHASRPYLQQFSPQPGAKQGDPPRYFYLRLVNRVYLVKTLDVSLFDTRAAGAEASAGAPRGVELLNIAKASEAEQRFEELNKIISKATQPGGPAPAPAGATMLPGGTVKVMMASSRSISLVETFARPLVIGFLAFDFPILEGGRVGPPVATFSQLENRPQLRQIEYCGCDANCERLREWRRANQENVPRLQTWLVKNGAIAIADLETGCHAALRARAVKELIEGSK